MAKGIHLDEHLLLGKGEESSGGREKSSILSSAYEALLGAIHLDGGYDATLDFVYRQFAGHLDTQQDELLGEDGSAHAWVFTVNASFRGSELGRGATRRQQAAQLALTRLLLQEEKQPEPDAAEPDRS